MHTLARTRAPAAHASSVCGALLTAVLTFCAGHGQATAGVDGSSAAIASPEGTYTYDAVTGAATTVAAGRTPGSYGVTHSGAASYRIPLWTPPGVGEVELELALVYNSRGGNGTLGVGWSLAGLSEISRCHRTIAQDGVSGGVTNTTSDRFCLDGQQLKLVGGSPGGAGSVYATELETYARIVANGTAGNGPLSFTVTSKNGLIYEYGGTTDSRVNAGNSTTVRTWALSGIRDRVGNGIAVSYYNDGQASAYTNGTYRVASIAYPTTATGMGPFYQVRFGYSTRPAGDVPVGYLAGSLRREPYQLDSISIETAGSTAPVKAYHLAYAVSPATGRIRLTSVQECSASSCLRPTGIVYQGGARGWQALRDAGGSASPDQPPVIADFDGDGLTDLLYPVNAGSGKLSWSIVRASVGGYVAPYATGLVTTSSTSAIVTGDFVGNGRTQFLIQQGGRWSLAGYGNNGFAVTSTGLVPGGEYGAADIDGDGLADLVAVTSTSPRTITVRRNTTSPSPAGGIAAQFAPSAETVWTVPATRTLRTWNSPRVADLNGDGRADLGILTTNQAERAVRFFLRPMLSNGFGLAFTTASERELQLDTMVVTGDWNADGCSDVIQLRKVLVSDCAGSFREIPTAPSRATGDGALTVMPADWDGDARTDLLYVDYYSNEWNVIPSTGEGAGAPIATGIAAPLSSAWFVHDADGDGLIDLGFRATDGKLKYHLNASATRPPDLATSFTDGFGTRHAPSYASISRSHHVRGTGARFPEVDFQAPLYVVNESTASDGNGGTFKIQFTYQGARRHLQGRGFLGFELQRIVDDRTGLVTVDHTERSFPFTGMHVRRDVAQGTGTTPVSSWSINLSQSPAGGSGWEQRTDAYVASTTQRFHEYGGTRDGELITDSTTSFTYADGFGNPTRVETITTDMDAASPFAGDTWLSTATYGYSNDASSNWCLGLPVSSSVTSTAPGQASMTRTVAFGVDSQACRITRQVLEPNTPELKVTSTYGYDGCGNLATLSVAGSNHDGAVLPARTTSFDYGSRCQLPETVANALGQSSRYEYRYDFGVPTRASDPNGLATTWTYDDYGRRTGQTLPDDTGTAWSYESCGSGPCWGGNDLRFVVYESRLDDKGTLVRSRQSFFDGLERLRSHEYQRAGGLWTQVDYRYDALGRRIYESRPYSATPNGHTTTTFDPLGRVTAVHDHDAAGVLVRATTLAHAGRSVAVTDALGRTQTRVSDIAGRLRRVIDPAPGGTTRYDYDSLGNLVRLEDPIGAVSSGTYNARGARTRWSDAAAGLWTYTYNSLNELVEWKDARGRSFSATYDLLGRLVTRTEPEGKSTYTWGVAPTLRNIGRLASKSGLGYSESYLYDLDGRLSSRTIFTDQAYQYDYGYNGIGELDTLTYPTSPVPAGQSGSRLRIRYGYDTGELALIENVTQAQPRTLWKLDAADDYGIPTVESVAAGAVAVASGYDPATGRLESRQSGPPADPALHQNLAYEWDAAGNLVQRRDLNQNRTEKFTVDALNRVTESTLDGVQNLAVTYDAAGNIRQKSDVGAYTYGNASRPHRVTSAGGETFTYDANGNVASRNGLAQQSASFNLPTLVQKSGVQAQFAYGPDHQRWRQVATYQNGTETTHYAGLLEKEATTSTGHTYWRHYVPTPGGSTIVISRSSDAKATTTYVLSDHLGSSDTLLDSNGNLYAELSFATFGARRGSDWKASTAPDWTRIANRTRQGFTGHEMLDNVALVHMGGRVYDPVLARFLSVDPIIGDLGDSQSVHPYAYVGNRPGSLIDPTGNFADGPCLGACVTIVASIVKTGLDFLFGGSGTVWLPGATAIPGQSAQSDVGICGPGTFSAVCGGTVLYATAPAVGGGPGTSSWVNSPEGDPYARENLEQFFIDLGLNAVDVLVLSPVYGARDAYRAAERGNYGQAVVIISLTACDVAKPCYALKGPLKAVKKLATTGGVKRQFVQETDRVFYRVYSENRMGKWVTSRPPKNRAWAREALSLPPGNTATHLQEVRVPAGTRLERSRASPVPQWDRTRGGAEQFELLDEIPPSSFGDGRPLD